MDVSRVDQTGWMSVAVERHYDVDTSSPRSHF